MGSNRFSKEKTHCYHVANGLQGSKSGDIGPGTRLARVIDECGLGQSGWSHQQDGDHR